MVMSLVCVSACVSNESYFSSSSKMGGLRGIYVASQLKENATVKRIAPEDLQTVISFDKVGPHFFSTFFYLHDQLAQSISRFASIRRR